MGFRKFPIHRLTNFYLISRQGRAKNVLEIVEKHSFHLIVSPSPCPITVLDLPNEIQFVLMASFAIGELSISITLLMASFAIGELVLMASFSVST